MADRCSDTKIKTTLVTTRDLRALGGPYRVPVRVSCSVLSLVSYTPLLRQRPHRSAAASAVTLPCAPSRATSVRRTRALALHLMVRYVMRSYQCSHVVLLDHILTSLPTRPRSLLSPQQVTQARHATARHARTPSSAPASPRRQHPKCVRDHLPPPFFARHCPPALHQRAAPLRANDVAPV